MGRNHYVATSARYTPCEYNRYQLVLRAGALTDCRSHTNVPWHLRGWISPLCNTANFPTTGSSSHNTVLNTSWRRRTTEVVVSHHIAFGWTPKLRYTWSTCGLQTPCSDSPHSWKSIARKNAQHVEIRKVVTKVGYVKNMVRPVYGRRQFEMWSRNTTFVASYPARCNVEIII